MDRPSRFGRASVEAAHAWRVPFEMARVDLDAPNRARRAEPDDRPVVPGAAAPLGFPAVAHVPRVARHDQVVPRSEEHVAAGDDHAAVFDRGEIDVAAPAQPLPVGHDVAVDAQPGDAAVGEDSQSHVRRGDRGVDREQVVRVALQRRARQDLGPRLG